MKLLTLEDEIDFGKHEGMQIEDLVEDHPQYVRFMIENGALHVHDEVMEKLERREARR